MMILNDDLRFMRETLKARSEETERKKTGAKEDRDDSARMKKVIEENCGGKMKCVGLLGA